MDWEVLLDEPLRLTDDLLSSLLARADRSLRHGLILARSVYEYAPTRADSKQAQSVAAVKETFLAHDRAPDGFKDERLPEARWFRREVRWFRRLICIFHDNRTARTMPYRQALNDRGVTTPRQNAFTATAVHRTLTRIQRDDACYAVFPVVYVASVEQRPQGWKRPLNASIRHDRSVVLNQHSAVIVGHATAVSRVIP
jgi:hypothetical protein